jgi:hypothetical protein
MLEFWMGKTDPTTIENCPTPDLTLPGKPQTTTTILRKIAISKARTIKRRGCLYTVSELFGLAWLSPTTSRKRTRQSRSETSCDSLHRWDNTERNGCKRP